MIVGRLDEIEINGWTLRNTRVLDVCKMKATKEVTQEKENEMAEDRFIPRLCQD